MANILQSCVLWRVLRAIGAFFALQAKESALFGAFRRAWQRCFICRVLLALVSGEESVVRGSFIGRILQWFSGLLAKCKGLRPCMESSIPGRILRGLLRWGENSRIIGWVFRDGIGGVVLTVLGLYAGVDWLLRDMFSIPVLSSTWDELLLVCTYALVLYQKTGRSAPAPLRITNLDLWAGAFVATGLMLIALIHPFPSVAVAGFRATCQYILWFFAVVRLIRTDKDLNRLYILMLVLAGLIAAHGVYQFIVGVPIPEHWTDQAEADVRTRVFSIFGSPNIMADYMVMFAPMAAGLAYGAKNKKVKYAAWFGVFLMCFACLFTMSRAGWVAMAVAVIIFALLVDRKLFFVMLAAFVAALFLPFVASRLGYLFTDEFAHSTANGGRSSRWALGLGHLYSSNPLLGFGMGMFGGAVAMQNQVYGHIQYFYLDNYYIKTLVEMGYVGLSMFIVMMASLLLTGCRSLYRAAKRKDKEMYPMAAGIFAGLCGVLTHCYFENIFEEPYMAATFWILAAMLVYIGIRKNEKENRV